MTDMRMEIIANLCTNITGRLIGANIYICYSTTKDQEVTLIVLKENNLYPQKCEVGFNEISIVFFFLYLDRRVIYLEVNKPFIHILHILPIVFLLHVLLLNIYFIRQIVIKA